MADAPIRHCSTCGTGGGGAYRLARAQGHRDGYERALADVAEQIGEAIHLAYEAPGQAQRIDALQHVRALVSGLRERARRRHG